MLDALFSSLLPFLLVLSFLVAIHEAGHYLVARWSGVAVRRFSVGMGPRLFGRTDRRGTEWCVSALPIGGYVAMIDNEQEKATAPEIIGHPFQSRSRLTRALVVLGGPAANAIFGFMLLMAISMSAKTDVTPSIVGEVLPDTPAAAAGLRPGDRIIAIENRQITRFREIITTLATDLDRPTRITVERDGEPFTLAITPRREVTELPNGRRMERGIIGVTSVEPVVQKASLGEAWDLARSTAYDVTFGTVKAIQQIISGTRSTDSLSGVVGMAEATGDASRSMNGLLIFTAMISLNLAIVNLLPIPVLDGGLLCILAVEAVLRRPIPERLRGQITMAGIALLAFVFVFTTVNDIRFLFN